MINNPPWHKYVKGFNPNCSHVFWYCKATKKISNVTKDFYYGNAQEGDEWSEILIPEKPKKINHICFSQPLGIWNCYENEYDQLILFDGKTGQSLEVKFCPFCGFSFI